MISAMRTDDEAGAKQRRWRRGTGRTASQEAEAETDVGRWGRGGVDPADEGEWKSREKWKWK